MTYGGDNIECRFEDFVEDTNQKIKELETMIRLLQDELNTAKRETTKVNITNQDIKNSLGSTIKTVSDIVGKRFK
jgi:CRP-like cAMP-binding protein